MLDYLIKNGRIVDGSGKKLYIASIGISNGKIITNVSKRNLRKRNNRCK